MVRILSYTLSVLLHGGVLAIVLFWPVQTRTIDLSVPIYEIQLVSLPGLPGAPGPKGDPGPAAAPSPPKEAPPQAPEPPKPPEPAKAPEPAAPPEPAKAPEPAPKVEPLPEKPKVQPKPAEAEPPVKGKDISPQKTDKKPEPKKVEEKPKPVAETKPQPQAKPEQRKATPPQQKQEEKKPSPPTSKQTLAQALQDVRKDAAKQEKDDRDALARELAQLRESVESPGFGGAPDSTGTGGGQGGQGGAGGPEGAYLRAVGQIIKEHWTFPLLDSRQVFRAQVEIRLGRSGEILDSQLVVPSGRSDFDASTLKAVQEAQQFKVLPPPPRNLTVIRINFNSQELQ